MDRAEMPVLPAPDGKLTHHPGTPDQITFYRYICLSLVFGVRTSSMLTGVHDKHANILSVGCKTCTTPFLTPCWEVRHRVNFIPFRFPKLTLVHPHGFTLPQLFQR